MFNKFVHEVTCSRRQHKPKKNTSTIKILVANDLGKPLQAPNIRCETKVDLGQLKGRVLCAEANVTGRYHLQCGSQTSTMHAGNHCLPTNLLSDCFATSPQAQPVSVSNSSKMRLVTACQPFYLQETKKKTCPVDMSVSIDVKASCQAFPKWRIFRALRGTS